MVWLGDVVGKGMVGYYMGVEVGYGVGQWQVGEVVCGVVEYVEGDYQFGCVELLVIYLVCQWFYQGQYQQVVGDFE